jgi:hypothetical protein
MPKLQNIQFFRGQQENLPLSLLAGEPAFTLDTKKFYIGNGASLDQVADADLCNGSDVSDLHNHDGQYTRLQIVTINNNYQAEPNQLIKVDCSIIGITVTLPSFENINDGDIIEIIDIKKNSETNNIIIDRNGNSIDGSANNFILDVNGNSLKLIYDKEDVNFLILNKEILGFLSSIDCGTF